ncbi:MAG: hypothetical protein H0W25_00045 [Acidimicrobiia bacterium]|nr:hypothetical protein [Acidimicrobiia bacterium]
MGVCLCLVLAFALFAVVQLTRTAIAAEQIDDRVDRIILSTPAIADSLTNVPRLDDTGAISARILEAARPLSGHLGRVIAAAESIDATAPAINASAVAINGSVRSINQSSTSILNDVRGIVASTSGIDDVAVRIRAGVAGINNRVDVVIDLANAIHSDLANVLTVVNNDINPHANSIDCRTSGSACTG